MAAAYRLSYASRVNPSNPYDFSLLHTILLRVTLPLLIVTMCYVPIITFVFDLIVK